MHFKKNRAVLSAIVAAAMTSTALMSVTASAERTKENKYGTDTYAKRFLSMYDDVIVNGVENGYLSANNPVSGGFNIPYHAIEELICEAPDYGHETTSEAMSYIVWIAAMNDKITKENAGKIDGVTATKDLAKAWKTLETLIPSADQQGGFFNKTELSSQVAIEDPLDLTTYPHEGTESNTGKNPLHSDLVSAYKSENREYLLHWLADVDDWYGFGGTAEGSKGKLTFINTFQRGDQESCFETIPHPCIETKQYGDPQLGMKFAFQSSCSESWSYTNAPDAEDRAIQAVYAANRWGVGDSSVTSSAAMMGDFCRNDMYDKYYKKLGCQDLNSPSAGDAGKHYLMAWYTAWGGDGSSRHDWAWQIGCSHAHQFYQNPLVAYALITDSGLKSGMKAKGAVQDYTTSLQRQIEFYMWLQSAQGPFGGGATNCYGGNYSKYPNGLTTFYDMAYIEQPVYADPGSNNWTGNQFWATQRLAELYYIVKTEGDTSGVKPGNESLETGLEKILDKWVDFFVSNTEITADGDYSVPSSLKWSGAPDKDWGSSSTYSDNTKLTCEIVGMGNADMGCANSLADTLIYYAKAKGVEASGTVKEGTTLPEKALYTAQQLMDRSWKLGRDDLGMSRLEHNGSLSRIWDQQIYIPSGKSGTYPHGYTVKSGETTFFDLRPMYANLPNYDALHDAYLKDKANGAAIVETTTGTDCSSFKEVEQVDLHYHRFWHAGDDLMAMGAMSLLYPDVTPSNESSTPIDPPADDADWGNTDCSKGDTPYDRVDVADAVLLARFLAEDTTATVSAQGKLNADVVADGALNSDDVAKILKFVARSIEYSEMGTKSK
ncbi:MAG: cellulose 1,4-beta-cellobiosidase [Oscillospiraceae bacterium]|nr:cellulose 1,4-beta-cellobiosidase [Oscillospiraceae bacterium]